MILILTILAVLTALKMAESVFAPFVAAIVIGVVFSPLTDWAHRFGLPKVTAAIFVLITGLGILLGGALFLERPVNRLIDQAPLITARIDTYMEQMRQMTEGLDQVTGELPGGSDAGEPRPVKVEDAKDERLQFALSYAPAFLAQVMIFIGAFFFFTLSRDEIYDAIARIGKDGPARHRIENQLHRTEQNVARYFLTITVINIGLGIATTTVMYALGLPSPLVWGVFAAALNFVPYLGPAVVIASLLAASLVLYQGLFVLVPPLCFFCLNVLEGQFITPAAVGRHMRVNPLLVFMSLIFWLWLWGPLGGFVAIPILLAIIALSDEDLPVRQSRPVAAE